MLVPRAQVSRFRRLTQSVGMPPRADSLAMVRWTFLAFSLASSAALLGLVAAQAATGRRLEAVVAIVIPLLWVKWLDEHSGGRRSIAWDLVEAASLLLVGVATGNPLTVLIVLYVRLATRALTETVPRLIALSVASTMSLVGAVLVLSLTGAANADAVACIFLATGFVIVGPSMHTLARTLSRLARSITREGELRAALSALAPAQNDDTLPHAAVEAVRLLISDPHTSVALASGTPDELHITALSGTTDAAAGVVGRRIELRNLAAHQRNRLLAGDGVHLTGEALADTWPPAEGAPPEALFLVPMIVEGAVVGLAMIAGAPVPEEDRVAITTLVAHIALRLTAARLSGELHQRAIDAGRRQSETNFRRLFEVNPLPMWLYDSTTLEFIAVNDAAVRSYGHSREDFLAMHLDDLAAAPPVRQPVTASDRRRSQGDAETRHRRRDGSVIDVEVESSRLVFEERDAVLMLARDVTAERELHRRLEHQTLHDALTGLANRRLFDAELERAIRGTDPGRGRRPAVIILDLDGFKTINDTLGHAYGDRVITTVAERLALAIRPGDTAARLAGDEFAILLNDTGGPDDALQVARRLVSDIERPLDLGDQSVSVSASAGVAPAAGGDDPHQLLGDADIAMYAAKGRGAGSCVLFEPKHRAALVDRVTLQAELTRALDDGQLLLHYQPQLDTATGRVVAVEALVRWQHPVRGLVPPDVFIPLGEQMGLVPAIDAWVLATACRQLRCWADEGLPPMRIAVNLSSSDLERADLVDTVRRTLLECLVDPWRLELELTESVAVSQPEAAVARLAELRAMGVRIAIDDFGTGYSMFSRLRALPVDRLKIDRSFVTDITVDDDARAIVLSTITMGHALGLDLVAEGVETAESYALLRDMGCDTAQGYHLSRPLPADQLSAWLRERNDGRPLMRVVGA